MARGIVQGLLEGATVKVDLGRCTAVAHGPYGLVIGFDGSPLSFTTVAVGLDPELQVLCVSIDETLCGHTLGVNRLDHVWFG